MADGTPIEWTDATWNPITGCSVVSPGCTNCYAMKLAGSRLRNTPSRAGLTRETKGGAVWTGEVRFNEEWLDQPLRWRRPRMIFVCAHADLFHENVPDEWIDRIFAVMALAPQHTFQVLTKRPERMRDYLLDPMQPARVGAVGMRMWALTRGEEVLHASCDPEAERRKWPLPNVWLGVSAEDQHRADERVAVLLDTPAALRWVSAEPLLGPIDFTMVSTGAKFGEHDICIDAMHGPPDMESGERLDWVVAGGESGAGARPMHPDWVRTLRDQCDRAGIPFLFKQWGSWSVHEVDHAGRVTPGMDMSSMAGIREWTGDRFAEPDEGATAADVFHGGAVLAISCGKKLAGRTIDGVVHDGFPVAQEVPFAP